MALADQLRTIYQPGTGLARALAKEGLYWLWVLNGYLGPRVSLASDQRATAILPVYKEERLRNIAPLIRALLKCRFIERVVISNHNPEFDIGQKVNLRDGRLVLLNQPVRRGCGYGWVVASKIDAAYFISIDDDLLLYPGQLARLFTRLIENPSVPHGLAGSRQSRYCEQQEAEVDNLYQIYAVTRAHVATYMEYVERITAGKYLPYELIEYWADDVIISRTGQGRPLIHDTGRLTRCRTASAAGVAIHREEGFERIRAATLQALQKVRTI